MNIEASNNESEFIWAAAAIYAWVSSVDGEVTELEINGFIEYVEQSEFVDSVSDKDFNESYVKMLELFGRDFDEGVNRARLRIEPFKNSQEQARSLVGIARKALVADGRLSDSEDIVLKEISAILGLDESA